MHELLSPRSPKECVFNFEAKQIQLHIINLQKCHPEKKKNWTQLEKGTKKINIFFKEKNGAWRSAGGTLKSRGCFQRVSIHY